MLMTDKMMMNVVMYLLIYNLFEILTKNYCTMCWGNSIDLIRKNTFSIITNRVRNEDEEGIV